MALKALSQTVTVVSDKIIQHEVEEEDKVDWFEGTD